jgi:predicted enzyme related to lactoylglutathione lyase
MARVTGIGGIFFRAQDPDALKTWYDSRLGIISEPDDGAMFHWRQDEDPEKPGLTVWSIFHVETDYFGPGDQTFMINYRVDDLDALLESLRAAGVEVAGGIDEYPYGRFAWIVDPEGNRVELWEPAEKG